MPHNPEVEGSNPSPATTNPSESVDSDGFPFVFITFSDRLFLPFSSDPNRDPYGLPERSGLETAGEDATHGFGRLPLGGRGHMGVGVQGEPRRKVPQHPGHRFHVYPVLEGQGGKCVPKLVEAENGRRSCNRQMRIWYINDKRLWEFLRSLFISQSNSYCS